MDWFVATIYAPIGVAGVVLGLILALAAYIVIVYLRVIVRVFEEKPIFIIPRGEPTPGSDDVRFPTSDGLMLSGSYLRTTGPRRLGVVLFGPEFGSNRWSGVSYCESLLAGGFDVFTFEFRNQGESDCLPGYEPLQWVTQFEVRDMLGAVAYLRNRSDAHPQGIGVFGISRGGGAGIMAAAREPWIRCVVTDGAFATCTTMVPYMQKWIEIYSSRLKLQRWVPHWAYVQVAKLALRKAGRRHGCRYPSMETAIPKLSPRPLLMIHGSADTYIKPEIARDLFDLAREPKEFWLVDGAKHNQALQIENGNYRRRILDFFVTHLAGAHSEQATDNFHPALSTTTVAAF